MSNRCTWLLAAACTTLVSAHAAQAPSSKPAGDIPVDFHAATSGNNFVKRDEMIPMRDGVKLHTVIIIPKGAARAPMILDRTPYSAATFTSHTDSTKPTAIPAGKIEHYHLNLPNVDHVFLPGHRLMVQVQSSWFPLYDRNPQSFVPSIFMAKPADYVKATQRV
jgi:predicted acyl esterase